MKETKLEAQTRAVHDLVDFLRLKTVQMDKYGCELDHKSNSYWNSDGTKVFMDSNKEKDNPGLDRENLAQIVTKSFNRRDYTRRKII